MGVGDVVAPDVGGPLLVFGPLEAAGGAVAVSPAAPITGVRLQTSADSEFLFSEFVKHSLAKLTVRKLLGS